MSTESDSYVKPMITFRGLIILVVVTVVVLGWTYVAEQRKVATWEQFKAQHDCVETQQDDKPAWVCNNGKTYF